MAFIGGWVHVLDITYWCYQFYHVMPIEVVVLFGTVCAVCLFKSRVGTRA
jgi:hypothetical protein